MEAANELSRWPELPYEQWRETRDTLHMYTQVVGKLRLALSPVEPNWAHVALYVTARGLTTSPLPVGRGAIDAELDLVGHTLVLRASDGTVERRPLGGAVADFHADVLRILGGMGVEVALSPLPQEVPDPIPFPDDRTHDTYDARSVTRFFAALSSVDAVMKRHHGGFRGRTSPVHFFWGTFDLALTRYSGRPVEPPPGAGLIERVGGDAEQICVGWWPGDHRVQRPSFFAYGFPSPEGAAGVEVGPAAAGWDSGVGEFLLPYDAVRSAADPDGDALAFFESTYAGTARLMRWDEELTRVHAP